MLIIFKLLLDTGPQLNLNLGPIPITNSPSRVHGPTLTSKASGPGLQPPRPRCTETRTRSMHTATFSTSIQVQLPVRF